MQYGSQAIRSSTSIVSRTSWVVFEKEISVLNSLQMGPLTSFTYALIVLVPIASSVAVFAEALCPVYMKNAARVRSGSIGAPNFVNCFFKCGCSTVRI